jgi:hypothetical protein
MYGLRALDSMDGMKASAARHRGQEAIRALKAKDAMLLSRGHRFDRKPHPCHQIIHKEDIHPLALLISSPPQFNPHSPNLQPIIRL